jgi:two-component system NtrC family response regulator
MPGMDGIDAAPPRSNRCALPVVLMTAYATVETAVDAMKQGAFDYIQKPFDGDELVVAIKRAVEHHRLVRENEACARPAPTSGRCTPMVGESKRRCSNSAGRSSRWP